MEQLWTYVTTPKFAISALIVAAAVGLWIALRRGYKKYISLEQAKGQRATLVRISFGLLQLLVAIGAVILVLQVNGENVNSILAGLGLISAIVGLALQDVLKDYLMGIHIIKDHYFMVGDVVKYEDIEGEVIGFTMQTTTLRNIDDNTVVTICNRNITEITKLPSSCMVNVDLPLSYDEDVKKVNKVLTDIAAQVAELPGIDRCLYKGTQAFDRSAIIYRLRFFCAPADKPERRRDVLRAVQSGLEAANIQIPYDQLDVHTKQA